MQKLRAILARMAGAETRHIEVTYLLYTVNTVNRGGGEKEEFSEVA